MKKIGLIGLGVVSLIVFIYIYSYFASYIRIFPGITIYKNITPGMGSGPNFGGCFLTCSGEKKTLYCEKRDYDSEGMCLVLCKGTFVDSCN